MAPVIRTLLIVAGLLAAGGSVALAQTPPRDTTAAAEARPTPAPARPAPAPDSAALASAYLDPEARELVRLARARRRVVDRSLEAYEATARERFSVGLRAVRRDRVLWQRETASRIAWEREGPVRIDVLGAREVLPALIPEPQVPARLEKSLPRLAFDPADPFLLTGWGSGDDDVPHPLASGSEADYRFRSGGTTVIRLPEGRDVRLRELQVLPRRRAGTLVQGSFWLDESTHAVVQATFRLAGAMDLNEDGDLPGILTPAVATLEYMTLEYGLWDSRWWLPRVFALRGAVSLGRMASLPLVYERTYGEYEVRGDPGSAALLAVEESGYAPGARVRCPGSVVIAVGGVGEDAGAARDSAAAQDSVLARDDAADTLTDAQRRACERIEVVVPPDTAALLASPLLSAAPFAGDEALLTQAELASIRGRLEDLAPVAWGPAGPRLAGPLGAPGLVRYNRVEALSLGARADMDLGPIAAEATARIGVADLAPNGELALTGRGAGARLRLAGYRRLVAMDPDARPFTLAASVSSLFLGRDEADYYRTLGAELTGAPAPSRPRRYDWRLYAQRERAAAKQTDFSLPHLLNETHRFPSNDPAAEATQYGAALRLRGGWGHDPVRFRLAWEPAIDGAVGTYRYARPSLTLRTGFPLPGPLIGLLEGAAGTSFGDPALQHRWRVGGPMSLRGYSSGAMTGASFWRGRAEVSSQLPAVRASLFSDAGWAGPTDRFRTGEPLLSAGVGVSALDGLVRLDVARALVSPTGWRVTAYLDAWR